MKGDVPHHAGPGEREIPRVSLVMCHGVFDLLHAGHVEHLRQARAMGDMLVVSLVPDRFVTKPGRPIYPQDERLALLKAIRHVTDVVLCDSPGPERLLLKYRPEIYARGSDYEGKAMPEDAVLREIGARVCYTRSVPPTTSAILGRLECSLHSS